MRGKKISPTHLRTFSVQRSEGEKKKKTNKQQIKNCYEKHICFGCKVIFLWKKILSEKIPSGSMQCHVICL